MSAELLHLTPASLEVTKKRIKTWNLCEVELEVKTWRLLFLRAPCAAAGAPTQLHSMHGPALKCSDGGRAAGGGRAGLSCAELLALCGLGVLAVPWEPHRELLKAR